MTGNVFVVEVLISCLMTLEVNDEII